MNDENDIYIHSNDCTITLGGGAAQPVYTIDTTDIIDLSSITISNGSSSNYTFANYAIGTPNPPSLQIGEKFSIQENEGSVTLNYGDKSINVGDLFSMVNAFKTLLISVAKDSDFCEKHPEIRDMAYEYMIQELKR